MSWGINVTVLHLLWVRNLGLRCECVMKPFTERDLIFKALSTASYGAIQSFFLDDTSQVDSRLS
jgi:hypothetical protein